MEYFNIYLNAYKNFKDYHSPSKRNELNWFILFYLIFWMIIFIPFMIITPLFVVIYKSPLIMFGILFVVGWIYFIVHAIPLLALVKRRLIDIIPTKANLIFWSFITFEVIRISISLFFMVVLCLLKEFHIWYILIGVINQVLSTITIGFMIFLMAKKGMS